MRTKILDWTLRLIFLFFCLVAASLLALSVGPGGFAPNREIIFGLRLPRVLLGVAVGGSLSVAGVLLQGLFRNPLVEPYTIGISGGAILGVALSVIFRLGERTGFFSLPLAGAAGAAVVSCLLYFLGMRKKEWGIFSLLLAGVMVSFICSSLMMLLMALSRTEDLQGIIMWTMGSLGETNPLLVGTALVVSLLGLGVSYFFALDLNCLALGEEEALHLGVDTARSKRRLFLLSALLTGTAVSTAGVIGFVGLVIPHLMRFFLGSDHRVLLAGSFLSGAAFLILCDTLARTIIAPLELPVGVITGILGGSLFIYTLFRQSNRRW